VPDILANFQLYIPHGSDESTSMRYANEVPNDDLYIPHGSDESNYIFKSWET